jgi:hypothetical protein
MHPTFHQEIARSRQTMLLREADVSRLVAEYKAANPRPGLLERLSSRIPQRRVTRPALGLSG